MMAADIFAGLSTHEWSTRMLFPEQKHAIWVPERELGKVRFDIKWVDKELNYEQQVRCPLRHPLSPSLFGLV
jgi:hypothetical protein